ncbi:sensor histidine kinase [Paenibacillus macerans]|uniref:histidine kinase n=1 Tax=Paenibacillus macerans TaxID=44252 RepID=A0A090ZFK3_PAEMA|nr:HAMP domain-containing sensor histidine kinase [Paenibacillus macerans]KFN09198.1 HAMP domain protein [Paenibacillus macerans]MCY7560820.1 HAMP domain-containing histidine kinase [Paenibacillus macerans]MEC0151874.1 HAMP domain-containing sensor histidine kinase [Paenibacillus macerans]SUA82937.1 integral membrane sensor signal transduction histidine kinase [Paenibacillus macerans]
MNWLKKIWKVLFHIFGSLAVLAVFGLTWTAATFTTSVVYRHWEPPFSDYALELLNVILGFILFVFIAFLIGQLLHNNQLKMLNSVIAAIRRIAKGDFSVRLEGFEKLREFESIVHSINEMASELGRMETMRQDFISNVSHEIQSPLTSIRGFARALRKPGLPQEKRDHYLEIIESESRRLSQMSDNLLKLSSLEAERATFQANRFRLDRQLKTVVLACEPQWLDKNIQINLDLVPVEVEAVEDLLAQVWLNLLYNSIKFTPHGGEITLTLSRGGRHAEVGIADSGMGIAKEDLVHIFERFYKADKSRTRSAGGSGLGLSIVKKIVEIHQGNISVASEPGQGTRFVIAVPYDWT